jgi:DNA-directed RNA polymerase specialized sigma24 family protein
MVTRALYLWNHRARDWSTAGDLPPLVISMTNSFVGKGARVPKHYVTRLAAALRAGQGAERLYDSYGTGLFGYCWAMVGDADEAAGALTDTMLVATSHADALADPADLTAWVFALARNECLRRRADAPPAASPYVCAPDADVLTMLVARALTDLRPADRELLDLTVRHRLSTAQLAHTLDIGKDDAAKLAEIAVTRFDQTLSTLFMASSGRLAVPHEIVADRPPLRVLLDLLPPPWPAEDLRGNLAAACVDPELDQYRRTVARRALPLDEDGFPRRLDPDRARVPGARPGVPPGVPPGVSPVPPGVPPIQPAVPAQRRPRPVPAAPPPRRTAYGTAAMPLGAPVAAPTDHPPRDRTTGGHPVIEPVDAGLIPPEAVTRARTASPPADTPARAPKPAPAPSPNPAPAPAPAPPRSPAPEAPASAPPPPPAPDGPGAAWPSSPAPEVPAPAPPSSPAPDGPGAGRPRSSAPDVPEGGAEGEGVGGRRARRRERQRARRRTGAGRFWYAVAVLLAVTAVSGGAWAAQQIFAPSRSSGARVAPSATGGSGAAPVPTEPRATPTHGYGHHATPTSGMYGTPHVPVPARTGRERRTPSGHPDQVPPATISPGTPPASNRPTTHRPSHTPTKSHSPTPTGTATPPGDG